MGRRVQVGLDLDVGSFIPPAAAAKKAVDGLGDEVEALDRDLNKIPADAAKAAASMKLLGGDVDGVGKKLTSMGDKSAALSVLDAKIRKSRSEVKKLSDEFLRTGDSGVFKKLGDEQGGLFSLTSVRKKLAGALAMGAEEGGKAGASTFSATFQGALQALPPEIKLAAVAALAGLTALVTPLLLSAVAGALLAGIGAAGIGGAVALAVRDPAVLGAFGELGTHISHQLTDAVTPYKAELLDVVTIFEGAWSRVGPRIMENVIAPLASELKPLAEGLVGFIESAEPGLEKAVAAAKPVLGMIADDLPMLGAAAGHFLEAISGDGAVEALHAILLGLTVIIAATGDLIGAAEKAFGWFDKVAKAVGSIAFKDIDTPKAYAAALWDVDEAATSVAGSTHLTSEQLQGLSSTLDETTVTADKLAGRMVDKLLDSMIRTRMGAIDLEQSYDDLGDSLKKNGKNFDIHTQKGRDNQRALLGVISANKEIFDTMMANGSTTEQATAAWNANTDALKKQLKAAGLSDDKIKELIGDMGNVPNSVNSMIAIQGLTDAINNLNDTIRLMNGLDGKVATSTVIQRHVIQYFYETYGSMADAREGYRTGANSKRALGGIRRAAMGMLIPPSDPGTTLVGEPQTGGEALIPLQGISQSAAMSLMSVVGDAYGLEVSSRYRSTGAYQPMARSAPVGNSAIDPKAFGVEVRRALAGMQVVIDGQRVGYLQGMSADYQRRGG